MSRAGWVLRMAWRDVRGSGRRAWLLLAAVAVGVAALVAIRSFSVNVRDAVDVRAKTLLGADLEIYGRAPFSPEVEELLASVGGEQAREVALGSMAWFPDTGDTRLVRARFLEGPFPFYGEIEARPAGAADALRAGEAVALVDDNLMRQFDARPGDPIRIGEVTFRIAGRLLRLPGEVPTASLVAPRVLLPMAALEATELLQPGSRARFSALFRLEMAPEEVSALVGELGPELRRLRLEAESVEYRRRLVGEALDDLYVFLYLAGLAALLIGSIGVASSVHLHARAKVESVAVLRCLGASAREPLAIFATQAALLGVVAAGAGALGGLGIQALLPRAFAGLLPVRIDFRPVPAALLEGVVAGTAVALVFALLPLVSLRRVTPLLALRTTAGRERAGAGDPARRLLLGLVALVVLVLAALQVGDLRVGAWVAGGLAVVLAALGLAARGLRRAARALISAGWPYAWRQGLANLYRPRNQTLVVMLALGFGAFVVGTLAGVEASVRGAVESVGVESRANLVLFDIRTAQVAPIRVAVEEAGGPILAQVPVVPMRLAALRGRPVAELGEGEASAWALRREYRATYRSEPTATEEVVAGEWTGRVAVDGLPPSAPVPISLERDLADDLNVDLGAELTFDVQGVPVPTLVGSLREVDWDRVSPNFLVVFPAGVLEAAPQQHVLVSRLPPEASARLQRQVVERFANVSILDLSLVLSTVDAVLGEVDRAVRFMALIVFLAGIAVLWVAVAAGRAQRTREAVLLRTLGASRGQLLRITLAEYLLLGTLAALTGLLLAAAATWALATFLLEASPVLAPASLASVAAGVVAVTLAVGWLGSRSVSRRPPLEVLREAAG